MSLAISLQLFFNFTSNFWVKTLHPFIFFYPQWVIGYFCMLLIVLPTGEKTTLRKFIILFISKNDRNIFTMIHIIAEGLDFLIYSFIYYPKVIFLFRVQYLKDLFPAGSTSEANTNTFNRNLLPLIQMSSLFFMAENPIIKPAEVILQSSSWQHNSLSGSEQKWDFSTCCS